MTPQQIEAAEVLANYQGYPNLKVITRELPDAQEGEGSSIKCRIRLIETLGLDENKIIVGVIDSDSTRIFYSFQMFTKHLFIPTMI